MFEKFTTSGDSKKNQNHFLSIIIFREANTFILFSGEKKNL